MNTNPKKVKLIIFTAIAIVVLLLVCITASLVSITINNSKLDEQKAEIEKLENEKTYYEYLKTLDDSLNEVVIPIPGENK